MSKMSLHRMNPMKNFHGSKVDNPIECAQRNGSNNPSASSVQSVLDGVLSTPLLAPESPLQEEQVVMILTCL